MLVHAWARFERLFSRTVRLLCTTLMALIFLMFLLNVFVRFVPVYNFTQTDDWIQACLIWMIFLGSAELVRTKNHFVVDFAAARVRSPSLKKALRFFVFLTEFSTYIAICWYGFIWVLRSNAYMQSIPWLQVRWVYLALPVSAAFMALFSAADILRTLLKASELPPHERRL